MRKAGPPGGVLSYLVLELLDERPRYGYEILKEIRELSGGHWEPSYGTVYPILYKLEEEGLANRLEREDEPDRKYFELTEDGRASLAQRRTSGEIDARDFADVILGYHHVFVALGTDERLGIEVPEGRWQFSEPFSAWIAEQIIRHHERDFGEFERIDLTPEEFDAQYGGKQTAESDGSNGSGSNDVVGDEASDAA